MAHAACWGLEVTLLAAVDVEEGGTDPETTVPERIFRFYSARFQIEFAFRDTKLHLGLNDDQTRSQAWRHFHFNIVFDILSRSQRYNLEEEIHQRFAARSAAGRNATNTEGRRRIPPEHLWLHALPPETGPAGP